MKRLFKLVRLFAMPVAAALVLQCGAVDVSAYGWETDSEGTQTLLSDDFSGEKVEGATDGETQLYYPKEWTITKNNSGKTIKAYADVATESNGSLTAPYFKIYNKGGSKDFCENIEATRSFTIPEGSGIIHASFKYSVDHSNYCPAVKLTDDNGNGVNIGSEWHSQIANVTVDGDVQSDKWSGQAMIVRNILGLSQADSNKKSLSIGSGDSWDPKYWRTIDVVVNTTGRRVNAKVGDKTVNLGSGFYAVGVVSTDTYVVKGILQQETGTLSKFTVKSPGWFSEGSEVRIDDVSVEFTPVKYVTEPQFENWKGVVGGGFKSTEKEENIPALLKSDASSMANLGIGWVRVGATKNGNAEGRDRTVLAANEKGINMIMCFYDIGTAEYTTESAAEYNEFLRDTVRRYKNMVKCWEIGNEQNLNVDEANGKTLQNYAYRLRDAYNIIKAEDPEATVVLGGISEWTAEDFVEKFASITVDDKPAYEYFDEVAFHPYGNNPTDSVGRLNAFKTAIKQHWGSSGFKPIWITEIGFHAESGWDKSKTPGYVESEEIKAKYLTEVMTKLHNALEIQRPVLWYIMHEGSGCNGYGLTTTPTIEDGTVTVSRLAAYDAMKAIKSKPAMKLPINDDFEGYEEGTVPDEWTLTGDKAENESNLSVIKFNDSDNKTYALRVTRPVYTNENWAFSNMQRNFEIPTGGGVVEINFRVKTSSDPSGYSKYIKLRNGDKDGVTMSYEWLENKNAIALKNIEGIADGTSKTVICTENAEWRTFRFKINCSDDVIDGLNPGEYIFSSGHLDKTKYPDQQIKGKMQNSLKSLNNVVFSAGNKGGNYIAVDDLKISLAEQPNILRIDSVTADNDNLTIAFNSSKTAVRGDIVVAAYKTENNIKTLSRIVGTERGLMIPVGTSNVTMPLGEARPGETYRVFAFDSIKNIRPIMDSINTQINE